MWSSLLEGQTQLKGLQDVEGMVHAHGGQDSLGDKPITSTTFPKG